MSLWTELSAVEHQLSFVAIGHWRTRVLEAGDGVPVVLLHGTGGHLEAWNRNTAALAQSCRVIAYDMPGHGYTTLTRSDLEIPHYVEHLRGLLDQLHIARAVICGESLGGWVAAKFAVAYPERVQSLVLNTPGGTMATPEVMERIRSLSQAAADNPTPQSIRARLEWLMADPSSVTDELVDSRRAIYAQDGFARSMSHILCLQDPETRRRNLLTDDDLAGISASASVIWTSDDPSGPAAAGQSLARMLPHGTFHLIAGAGHWPQWEQPAQFNDLLLAAITSSQAP